MNDDVLRTNLLDLLHALEDDAQKILLGGGYGLYLKQLHLAEAGVRTLIDAELWPSPRATEDLDLMLSAEFVGDLQSMTSFRAVLDKLDYKVKRLERIRIGQFTAPDLSTGDFRLLSRREIEAATTSKL